MRKYLEIAKLLFKAQLAWRASIAFNMLFTVLKILFAVVVWGAIYADNAVVGGFTLQGMLTYYVVSSFFSQLDISEGVAGEVSARIRNGTFSRYMVIPVRAEGYFHAQNYGAAALYMLFNLVAAAAWTLLFGIEFTLTGNPGLIAGALVLEALGLVFMVQLNFFLGILTFRFGDISLFLMIKNNLLAIVTGTMLPLSLFPEPLIHLL
ncbi:MAG TPA: ABC-2 family transporter protein, partial [Clostridia bacterium]|nr:ABC-2 family transporter protein [Clostridia bacterium]